MPFYFSNVNVFLSHTMSKSWLIEFPSSYYSNFTFSVLKLGQSEKVRTWGLEWYEELGHRRGLKTWDGTLGNLREAGHRAILLGRMTLHEELEGWAEWHARRTWEAGVHRILKLSIRMRAPAPNRQKKAFILPVTKQKLHLFCWTRELTSFLKILSKTANENGKCTMLYYSHNVSKC